MRRNKKKEEVPSLIGGASLPALVALGSNGTGGREQSNHSNNALLEKKKPSPEELALTAKNYRMAKELSELRVRHREECKAVTRLTMENVSDIYTILECWLLTYTF